MNKNTIVKKVVSISAALCMTLSSMWNTNIDLFADTQSELEAHQAELAEKRKDIAR